MPAKFFLPIPVLQSALDQILETTWDHFPQLAPNQIALTWIVYEPPYQVNTGGALSAEAFWQYQPQGASYRGVELIEPGGMVALFYWVAVQVWLEQGMMQPSAELKRAMGDMLAGSTDAMSYVVDALSGTSSGPELSAGPAATWEHQRNIVNRYFQQVGWPELRGVNLNQKIWCDRPYGREKVFLGDERKNKNRLSTEVTARLLHSIIGGVSVSRERSQHMMTLLKQIDDSPITTWAHAGDSAGLSYSACYVEAPEAHPYQLVTFIEGQEAEHTRAITSLVSQQILAVSQQMLGQRLESSV
ncbi:MAG: serine hydrolase [Cyanobacteria bacterium P01_D01_bin.105]